MREKRVYKAPTLEKAKGLFHGVVAGNMLPNGTVKVRLQGFGTDINCIWAAGIFSGLLGFKVSYMPPMKTKVVVLYTGQEPSYIIGCVPGKLPDTTKPERFQEGDSDANYHASQIFSKDRRSDQEMFASHKPPVDLVDGELMIDNMMGVALGLLRHLAYLSAGDLARVECFLQDDMVRIISKTFKHYTAFGDYRIVNDGGKLNVIWNGTSHDFEAWGLRKEDDPKATLNKSRDQVDMSAVDQKDDGRWRFSQYIGWLGNFINIFVTDPVQNIGKLAEGQFRSGKARFHVNNDGSMLFQSVADIVLEKVVRIPVPVPLRSEDDPEGDRSDDVLGGEEFLKSWQPSDNANVFEMVYQLRNYARWLNNAYSLGRFRQMKRDYQVPTEAQTPEPNIADSDETDKKKNSVPQNWRFVYATIRIYRDGSVQQLDAYGNSITMTSRGVQIASTKDVLIQAAGSVNMVAGRDINLVARKNLNLSAVTEKLRMHAKKGLLSIVENGHWIVEVLGDFVAHFKSTVNFNNTATVEKAGDVNVQANLRAGKVGARITDFRPCDNSVQGGHVFNEAPVIASSVDEKFEFQTDYAAGDLYETLSQQTLANNEQVSSGTWDFDSNKVSGRGAPWPGEGVTQKVFRGGENLNTPSGSVPNNTASPMTPEPVKMKYQS